MKQLERGVGRVGREALVALLLVAGTNSALGNSIEARPDASLRGAVGLALRLDDPAAEPPVDAYLVLGADKGLAGEDHLEIGFSLDPAALSLQADVRVGSLPFLRLSQGPQPVDARLVLALTRAPLAPWTIVAWSWDDVEGRYVLAGQATLQRKGQEQVRLDLRWSALAGQAGSLRLVREEGQGQRTVLFENSALANTGQVVDAVQIGALATDPQGLVGRLLLDDFEVYRIDTGRPRPRSER